MGKGIKPQIVLEDHIHEALAVRVVVYPVVGGKSYMLVIHDLTDDKQWAVCIGASECVMRAFERVLKKTKPERIHRLRCQGLDCKGCLC